MENYNLKEFSSERLKNLREKAGLSQQELAEQLTILKLEREKKLVEEKKKKKIDNTPITRQTVSKYELGRLRMNADIIFDLAKIFNKNINYFFPDPLGSDDLKKAISKIEKEKEISNLVIYKLGKLDKEKLKKIEKIIDLELEELKDKK